MTTNNKILSFIFILILSANTANAGLFGSLEKKNRDLIDFPKWTEMLQRFNQEETEITKNCNKSNCHKNDWLTFIDKEKSLNLSKMDIIKSVHSYINSVKYIEDNKLWNQSDYWATPFEFIAKGGDCEDFAIAKFLTLRKLGFSNDEMRIVVLNDRINNRLHSVLIVYIDNKPMLLDNEIPVIVPANDIRHYDPIYSINETTWWRHIV